LHRKNYLILLDYLISFYTFAQVKIKTLYVKYSATTKSNHKTNETTYIIEQQSLCH